MGEAGRPTDLNKELLAKIKEGVFKFTTLKEIANFAGISESTLYHWNCDNYANLSDKIRDWRLEKKLEKSDRNIDSILDLPVEDKGYTKVVADMSKFIKETLDKEHYSKRSELTGKDGKDLPTPIMRLEYEEKDN